MLFRTTLILTLAIAPAVSAQSWSASGPKGGAATGGGTCTDGNAAPTCNRSRTVTGPNGETIGWSQSRSFANGDVTTTRTGYGPNRSGTNTWTRKRK